MSETKANDNKPNYIVIGILVLIILICVGVILYMAFKPNCPELKCPKCPECVKCPERQCRGTDPVNYDIVGNELKIGQVLYPCQAIRSDDKLSSFMIQDNGDIYFIRFGAENGNVNSLISLGKLANATLKSADSFVITLEDGNTLDIFKNNINFKQHLQDAKLLPS